MPHARGNLRIQPAARQIEHGKRNTAAEERGGRVEQQTRNNTNDRPMHPPRLWPTALTPLHTGILPRRRRNASTLALVESRVESQLVKPPRPFQHTFPLTPPLAFGVTFFALPPSATFLTVTKPTFVWPGLFGDFPRDMSSFLLLLFAFRVKSSPI